MPTLRVWSETLPLTTLSEPATLALLRDRSLGLLAAVRPWDLDHVPTLCRAARDAGVSLGLWPMIEDEHGRWANAVNLDRFGAHVSAVKSAVPQDAPIDELAVDLEPPFGLAAAVGHGLRRRQRPPVTLPWTLRWRDAVAGFDELSSTIASSGARTVAAAMPMVLLDPREGDGPWQRAMGTPVLSRHWDHVTVMAYTSLFEGWSLRAFDRRAALGVLRWCCREARARYDGRAGVSLGAIGTGAFGTEPVYRDPYELREDVALCRSEGIEDLTLFDLGGAISRGPSERWLDAFVEGAAHPPAVTSRRAEWVMGAGRVAASALRW